jgi:hypothetical protein
MITFHYHNKVGLSQVTLNKLRYGDNDHKVGDAYNRPKF